MIHVVNQFSVKRCLLRATKSGLHSCYFFSAGRDLASHLAMALERFSAEYKSQKLESTPALAQDFFFRSPRTSP